MSTSLFDCPNKRFFDWNSIKRFSTANLLNVRVADCEMPPIIRRAPLSERIKAYLNPYDLLLWIAEELHESALDEALRDWGMPVWFHWFVSFPLRLCCHYGTLSIPMTDLARSRSRSLRIFSPSPR
jgi:hypothetical protein